MTAPTAPATAAQLLSEAAGWLEQLYSESLNATPDLWAIAAAWPQFAHAGDRLLHALSPASPADPQGPTPGRSQTRRSEATRPFAWPPEPHLARAADLLGAAADLVATRDRRPLPASEQARDLAVVSRYLVATAGLVEHLTLPDASLQSTINASRRAASDWRTHLAVGPQPTLAPSLPDAAAGLSYPADDSLAARLSQSLHTWQNAALDAARGPAPAGADLQQVARAGGWLLALTQRLLLTQAGPLSYPPALDTTLQHLRAAGELWNNAARLWDTTAASGARSPQLAAASTHLARTFSPLLTQPKISNTAAADTLVASILAALQPVADAYSRSLEKLVTTGSLAVQARNLPVPQEGAEPDERLQARLTRRWTALSPAESWQAISGLSHLGPLTAQVRLAHHTLVAPEPPWPPALALLQAYAPQLEVPLGAMSAEPAVTPTMAGQRWAQAISDIDPRLLHDTHYPALAAALDRVELRTSKATALASLDYAATEPLPDRHPARTLHARLVDTCPDAIIPSTLRALPPLPPARLPVEPRPEPATPLSRGR